jgi:hypothetical protein
VIFRAHTGTQVSATVTSVRNGRNSHSYQLDFDYKSRLIRVWVQPMSADPDYDVGTHVSAVASGSVSRLNVATSDMLTSRVGELTFITISTFGGLALVVVGTASLIAIAVRRKRGAHYKEIA